MQPQNRNCILSFMQLGKLKFVICRCSTLSPIIMEVENSYIWAVTIIGGSHLGLRNHDYGRKCSHLALQSHSSKMPLWFTKDVYANKDGVAARTCGHLSFRKPHYQPHEGRWCAQQFVLIAPRLERMLMERLRKSFWDGICKDWLLPRVHFLPVHPPLAFLTPKSLRHHKKRSNFPSFVLLPLMLVVW